LARVAGLRPFSVQAYITGSLLDWMREQVGEIAAERIVAATHFVAAPMRVVNNGGGYFFSFFW
jgi:hypothetical protein